MNRPPWTRFVCYRGPEPAREYKDPVKVGARWDINRTPGNRDILVDTEKLFVYHINHPKGPLVILIHQDLLE